jgi:hypothetical protein
VRVRRVPQLPIARPTLERRYGLMAEAILFQTNDPALLAGADASFGRFPVPSNDRQPLVIRLFSEALPGEPGGPRPLLPAGRGAAGGAHRRTARLVHRTHGNLLLVSRGSDDIAAIDLDAGVGLGFVSAATAQDQSAVRYAFIEAMGLSMLGRSRGYLALHAAGVVRGNVGVVLQGPAGAGKSTLAMACARRGYGVFAEDAVFVRVRPAGLELWGLPWTQRLVPDARRLFPELAAFEVRRQANGESKLEVDLDVAYPGRAVPSARPGLIVLLERGTGGATRIEPLDAADDEALEVLWPFDGGWTPEHERGSTLLGTCRVYRLHMNATPDVAVDALEDLLDRLSRPTTGP